MSDFTDDEKRFAELVLGNLDDNGFLDLKGVERDERHTHARPHDRGPGARGAGLDPEDAPEVLRDDAGVRSGRRLLARSSASACASRPRSSATTTSSSQIIDKHLHNLEKHNYQAIARDLKVAGRRGLRGGQGDPEAREPPGAQLHRDRREDDRHHARRLRHQGRRQVRRHRQRPRRAAPLHQRDAHEAAPEGPATPRSSSARSSATRSGSSARSSSAARRSSASPSASSRSSASSSRRASRYLKPMILRDVAEAVGMHESTISRVTTNKYVHTPQGLFELKYFFNSSIRRVADEDIACESVKQAIKKIIDDEDKSNPSQRSGDRRDPREAATASRSRGAPSRSTARCSASSRRASARSSSDRRHAARGREARLVAQAVPSPAGPWLTGRGRRRV